MTDDIATVEPTSPAEPETDEASEEAPYGWMTDPATGEKRPKKRPGRRSRRVTIPSGRTPALDELKTLGTLAEASEDTAPGASPKAPRTKKPAPKDLPPFRAGVIAKGVNRLYRRAGRIARMFHYEIGTAIIQTTKKRPKDDDDEDDDVRDDLTVGEAWENLAKSNPKIRAFLLFWITGGDVGALFWAHLPILMAIVMVPAIRDRIPFMDLATAFLTDEPDEEGAEAMPSGLAQMMGGINPQDMAQMMAFAEQMMGPIANNVARGQNVPRDPTAGAGGYEHPQAG